MFHWASGSTEKHVLEPSGIVHFFDDEGSWRSCLNDIRFKHKAGPSQQKNYKKMYVLVRAISIVLKYFKHSWRLRTVRTKKDTRRNL